MTKMPVFLSFSGYVSCSYLNNLPNESKRVDNCQTLAKIFTVKNILLLFYCNLMTQLSESY